MNRERDNLKAGLFVSIGIGLAVVVVFVLTDLSWLFEQRQQIQVYFRLNDGLHGLKEGAAVTLGDQVVGDVIAIQDKVESDQGDSMRVVGKTVTAQIPTRYTLYQNAVIELKAPLIGTGTTLNVRSVGEGQLYTGDQPIDGAVAGSVQVQELVRETGIQEQQRQQIRNIIANIEAVTATLRQEIPSLTGTVREILADSRAITSDLKQTVADAGDLVGALKQRQTVWLDRIDQITASAQQSLLVVDDLIQDKDPQVRQTVDHLHQLSQVAKEKTIAQVNEAIEKANMALDQLKATASLIRSFSAGQLPMLERTLANAKLASDQLKLTAIEVRRSPWRLLYDPDDKEISTDNIYDAARSFALAASMLDTTARSLQALVERGPDDNQEQIQKLLGHLEAVFSKFKETETVFWNAVDIEPTVP